MLTIFDFSENLFQHPVDPSILLDEQIDLPMKVDINI